MQSTKIFPFERNQYYYGKLLSVEDFNLEQQYNCRKSRMNHMFLSGAGIVSGLYTGNIGEQTISVETGCAIDSYGREMAVSIPVVKKLKLIDGFEEATANGQNYIYLCMEYAEKDVDPVFHITEGIGEKSNDTVFNKVEESYHMFLTNKEPEYGGYDEIYETTKRLYFDKGICICQSIPRYMELGKKAVLTIDIETPEKNYLAFSYQLSLNGLTYQDESMLSIQFDELLVEKSGKYHLSYELEVCAPVDYEASISLVEDSFKVVVDQQPKQVHTSMKLNSLIVEDDIRTRMIDDYYKMSMDTFFEKARKNYLYLAKIYITKADQTYFIHKVVNAPFRQYVLNQSLLGSINRLMVHDIRKLEEQVGGTCAYKNGKTGDGEQNDSQIRIATGTYEMIFGNHGENKKKFFSPPIAHGLGLGYVTIILSLRTRKDESVFGNAEIFEESYVDVDLAAQLDETTGCFIIGARLRETVAKTSIQIQWTAIRKKEEKNVVAISRRMSIKPGMLELYTRESASLEVLFYHMEDKKIQWNVKEGGGTVDSTNIYTAPNEKGVYEVTAQSIAYPEVKASIFAIVRERD